MRNKKASLLYLKSMENSMQAPDWYLEPNGNENLEEQLEYEKRCLNQAQWDFNQALTADSRDRANLDIINTRLRIATLEDKLDGES